MKVFNNHLAPESHGTIEDDPASFWVTIFAGAFSLKLQGRDYMCLTHLLEGFQGDKLAWALSNGVKKESFSCFSTPFDKLEPLLENKLLLISINLKNPKTSNPVGPFKKMVLSYDFQSLSKKNSFVDKE